MLSNKHWLTAFAAVFAVALSAVVAPRTASAINTTVVYQETNGIATVEAEFFTNRTTAGNGTTWVVKPGENSGTGSIDGGPIISNFRGTGYVQLLPNNQTGAGPNIDPLSEYQIQIDTTGTYQLYLRWDGDNTNGTTRGQSDSMFAGIKELKDGPGGAIADHYEYAQGVNGNFASPGAWDATGGKELNSANAAPQVAATFDITSPGIYTVQLSQREDGAAVDAFSLQLASLAAPTGAGANSATVLNHNVKLTPTDDAFVRQGAANQNDNFGSSGQLLVKENNGGNFERKSYIKFDVSDVDLSSVVDAALNLEIIQNNNGGNPLDPTPKAYTIDLFGLNDGNAGEGWSEGTITAANAPENDLGSNGFGGDATLLASLTVPAINPDLTSDPVLVSFLNNDSSTLDAVLEFLRADSDGQVTFMLRRSGGLSNNFGFASKENGNAMAPTLSLFSTNPTIPEPTTALLGLMGLAGLASRRRRAA